MTERDKYKKNITLNFTKRTDELASCVCLYTKERSSQKIQGLNYRLRIKPGVTMSRTVPSLFVRGQNFLKNVVSLEIRERVNSCHCEHMRSNPADKNNKLDSFGQALRRGKSKGILRSLRSLRMTGGKCIKKINHFLTYLPTNLLTFKPAFTLAEVLITLGIIGVVAALTIPNLLTAHKKHVIESKLERAVSVINQTIKMSESENGEMETWDKNLTYPEFIDRYFRPHIKIMQICEGYNTCGYQGTQNWTHLNGTKNGAYHSPFNNGRVPFISMDGILYVFGYKSENTNVAANNDKIIIIDINGSQKPNVFGQDVFFLYRDEEADSIIPYGADKGHDAIKSSCSKTSNGMYCAAWIRENGWKIPNGYPLK